MNSKAFQVLRDKYDFQWEVLDVIISGKSLIDLNRGLTGVPLRNREEAERFITSYGFSLEDPIEKAEIFGHFHEALAFVRKYFLKPENPEGLELEIPRKILELTDIRDLLLMASVRFPGQMQDREGVGLQRWACSLLKVMHTLAHLDKDLRNAYFSQIQNQILDRFYKLAHRDEDGRLYLGENHHDPLKVDLVAFETKPKKSRESMVLKLLHKADSVSEDIFDQVGVRFVTYTRLDALRVVKYLKDQAILMPANIKPSRSRNTLIAIEPLRGVLGDLLSQAEAGVLSENELQLELEALLQGEFDKDQQNPHSSDEYRAMQFTVRQLIKLRNPVFDEVRALREWNTKEELPLEVKKTIDRIDFKYIKRELRFFYPFEVQIMDEKSAEENERGRSAHHEYKKAQLLTAMKRVMGPLLDPT